MLALWEGNMDWTHPDLPDLFLQKWFQAKIWSHGKKIFYWSIMFGYVGLTPDDRDLNKLALEWQTFLSYFQWTEEDSVKEFRVKCIDYGRVGSILKYTPSKIPSSPLCLSNQRQKKNWDWFPCPYNHSLLVRGPWAYKLSMWSLNLVSLYRSMKVEWDIYLSWHELHVKNNYEFPWGIRP